MSLQLLSLAPTILESLLIIALKFPAHPYSQRVLSLLSHIANPSSLSASSIYISPAFVTGWALAVGGYALRLTCFRYLGRFFTFELALQEGQRLVKTGPYSVVRHPAYSGTIAIVVGLNLVLAGPGSLLAECVGLASSPFGIFWVGTQLATSLFAIRYVINKARAEDEVFRKEFGAEWEEWAKKTRYRLIPLVY